MSRYYPPPQYPRVAKTRTQTSHTFHLLMTLLTFGMWGIFVWLPITVWHWVGPRRRTYYR